MIVFFLGTLCYFEKSFVGQPRFTSVARVDSGSGGVSFDAEAACGFARHAPICSHGGSLLALRGGGLPDVC
jgi:hypothetical protein